MPKFKYTGEKETNLAGHGKVKPGAIITVTDKESEGLRKHGSETWSPVTEKAEPAKPAATGTGAARVSAGAPDS